MDNDYKKWLIGCGGCLLVVVVLFLVTAGMATLGVQSCQSGQKRMTQVFFGEETPKGYMVTIAMEKPVYMLQLMNFRKERVLTLSRMTPSEKVYERYSHMNSSDMKAFSKEAFRRANATGVTTSVWQGETEIVLFGKSYPVTQMTTTQNSITSPALMTAFAANMDGEKYILSIMFQDSSPRYEANDTDSMNEAYKTLARELKPMIESAAFAGTLEINQSD